MIDLWWMIKYFQQGIFLASTLLEANRISRASLDSDLLSAKSLGNRPPMSPFFPTLEIHVWLFAVARAVISYFLTKLESTNILSMAEYQIRVGQSRTFIIPSALSCLTFERILTMTKIGENAKKIKWNQTILNTSTYVYVAPGSSLNAP